MIFENTDERVLRAYDLAYHTFYSGPRPVEGSTWLTKRGQNAWLDVTNDPLERVAKLEAKGGYSSRYEAVVMFNRTPFDFVKRLFRDHPFVFDDSAAAIWFEQGESLATVVELIRTPHGISYEVLLHRCERERLKWHHVGEIRKRLTTIEGLPFPRSPLRTAHCPTA